jgi:Rrf2 family protein
VHVTAKADYAMRAIVEIAGAPDGRAKAEQIAAAQDIPLGFLRGILTDLRRAGLIVSQRSANGGFRLARPAAEISLGDVVRSVEGPLAQVRGLRPTELDYQGSAAPLRDVWIALRSNLRAVLDHTTIADVASGKLPKLVQKLAADPRSHVENF